MKNGRHARMNDFNSSKTKYYKGRKFKIQTTMSALYRKHSCNGEGFLFCKIFSQRNNISEPFHIMHFVRVQGIRKHQNAI